MNKTIIKYSLVALSLTIALGCSPKKDGFSPSTVVPTPAVDPQVPTGCTDTQSDALTALSSLFSCNYSATITFSIGFKPSSYMNSGGTGTVIGVCEVYSDGSKKVWFNQDWWGTGSTTYNAKKILFYHELGHCQFNRAHDSRTYSGGRPYTIMNPVIDPVLFYYNAGYSLYYLNELSSPMPMMTSSGMTSYPVMVNEDRVASSADEPVELIASSSTKDDGSCVEK